jgi:hypothetical protein
VPTLYPVTDETDAPFSVRIGARLPDRDLYEGVPDWLLDPLLDWLQKNLRAWSARQLSIRHRIGILDSDAPEHAVRVALGQRARESESGRWDVLDAIDYLCQSDLDGNLAIHADWSGKRPIAGSEPLAVLNRLLATGGSAYHYRKGRLERRVDDATVAAFEHVTETANDVASLHVRRPGRLPTVVTPSLREHTVRQCGPWKLLRAPRCYPRIPSQRSARSLHTSVTGQTTGVLCSQANRRRRESHRSGS